MPVELWKSIFDWATVVFIAFTVVSGAGALITGDIINKRLEAKLRQFDGDLTGAKTELARQQKRAADAEKELKQVGNTAIEAQERAAQLTVRAEELHKENLELEQNLSPRMFKDQLGAGKRLAAYAPVKAVIEYLPDWECKRTAGQIAQPLHDFAKWELLGVRANPDDSKFFDEVIVQVEAAGAVSDDVKRAATAADSLVEELNKTNIKARRHAADLNFPPGVVVIRVGLKPNPTLERLLSKPEPK